MIGPQPLLARHRFAGDQSGISRAGTCGTLTPSVRHAHGGLAERADRTGVKSTWAPVWTGAHCLDRPSVQGGRPIIDTRNYEVAYSSARGRQPTARRAAGASQQRRSEERHAGRPKKLLRPGTNLALMHLFAGSRTPAPREPTGVTCNSCAYSHLASGDASPTPCVVGGLFVSALSVPLTSRLPAE